VSCSFSLSLLSFHSTPTQKREGVEEAEVARAITRLRLIIVVIIISASEFFSEGRDCRRDAATRCAFEVSSNIYRVVAALPAAPRMRIVSDLPIVIEADIPTARGHEAGQRLASSTAHPSSLATRASRRKYSR
jgi:hypothetical protein